MTELLVVVLLLAGLSAGIGYWSYIKSRQPAKAADAADTTSISSPTLTMTVSSENQITETYDLNTLYRAAKQITDLKWREGFLSEGEIVHWVVEALDDEYPDTNTEDIVNKALDASITEFQLEQATWPSETDCDRLDAVFAELDDRGLVARQNFSCCQNCGHGEMLAEMEEQASTHPVRGYVFYHMQDTERAADGDGLYLAYGDESEEPDRHAQIGREISEALINAGFTPRWNGTAAQRIFVPIEWRKRRTAN